MKIEAHAKINLALDIVGRRSDGYHLVRMVMQSLKLHDTVEISKFPEAEGLISLYTDSDIVKDDESNLAWKAARLLIDEFGIREKTDIRITKRIPVAAGLAGGSSDAAAVLKGMNAVYDLGLTENELRERGLKLGADVPYCISGGTMLSEGIGEILTKAEGGMPECGVLLVKPRVGVSTKKVYEAFDNLENAPHADVDGVLEALGRKDLVSLSERLSNVLESVTIAKLPVIDEIKRDMKEAGAAGTLMSGSGPTVFALFDNEAKLKEAEAFMKNKYSNEEIIVSGI